MDSGGVPMAWAHRMIARDDDNSSNLSPADEFLSLIQNPFKESVSPHFPVDVI